MHSTAQARGSALSMLPRQASAAARQRTGRNRLPPAKTPYALTFSRGEKEDPPQLFAPGKKTVPHRLMQRDRFRARFRQIPIKRAVDPFLASPKIPFEIHAMESDAKCSILVTG